MKQTLAITLAALVLLGCSGSPEGATKEASATNLSKAAATDKDSTPPPASN